MQEGFIPIAIDNNYCKNETAMTTTARVKPRSQ